jgi:hypothetical protein
MCTSRRRAYTHLTARTRPCYEAVTFRSESKADAGCYQTMFTGTDKCDERYMLRKH